MPDSAAADSGPRQRPRVEGSREEEILHATIMLVAEVGYDRLTMDAVAAAAKAGKATLYRRWSTKAELVADAISRSKDCPVPGSIDTGSLRGDLLELSCDVGGFTDEMSMSVMAGLLTALQRNPDLREAFQERFLAPRLAVVNEIYAQAVRRGEIGADVDLLLLSHVIPALTLHQAFILAVEPDDAFVVRVIDHLILPAARGCRPVGPGAEPGDAGTTGPGTVGPSSAGP